MATTDLTPPGTHNISRGIGVKYTYIQTSHTGVGVANVQTLLPAKTGNTIVILAMNLTSSVAGFINIREDSGDEVIFRAYVGNNENYSPNPCEYGIAQGTSGAGLDVYFSGNPTSEEIDSTIVWMYVPD